jgi:PHD/YefM family antitoxin component YafN of YafNO toxin-antitoxin module
MEKRIDILDLPPETRELVGECELTGRRTLFLRNGRPVVALVSFDEWLALKETIDISADAVLRAHIASADEQAQRNELMAMEDLLEDAGANRGANQKPETRNQKEPS